MEESSGRATEGRHAGGVCTELTNIVKLHNGKFRDLSYLTSSPPWRPGGDYTMSQEAKIKHSIHTQLE